ncbi:apolipoprotein N-acyltransferase [Sphingosinithalassobacter sp. LHW66-3]|uniref:apolipoprotein N-acyltransferase n=1 Tax=Sphingosinithalassobacter sp. LHW66-3 TaxID=3424718 RepID=UPI003D6A1CF4
MLRRPLLTLLVAGTASAAGFAPLSLWPVLLACLAVLLWLVFAAPTLRSALLRGWVFGVGHFTIGNNWIQHAFDYQDKMPPVLGYFAVVLLALYLAVYPAMAAGLAWKYGRRGTTPDAPYVLIFAAGWIVTEWLRATMFTGYSWNPLGVAWLPLLGIAQLAQLVGTYALSGVTILAAGALLLLVRRDWKLPAALAGVFALALVFLSPGAPPDYPADHPRVRVVQPNIGQEGVSDPDYAERVFAALIGLSGGPGPAPRLVVWPEGMVNYYIESGYPQQWYWQGSAEMVRRRIAALLGPRDRALVGGNALLFDEARTVTGASNSVFVVTPDAQLAGRYDKAHLVPYGEYLPLRAFLGPLGLARLVMGDIDFIPGPGPQGLAVPGFGTVGMQICYEIIFSGQVVDPGNRPALLFNPSNDAWFGSWGPPQHLAQARMRALEEGLPILRATPTGISAVIDADGRLLASIAPGTADAVEVPLPRPHPPTLFARLGNWLALLVALLFAGGAIAIRRFAR